MALSDILARIAAEADAEVARLAAEAESDAAARLEAARAEADGLVAGEVDRALERARREAAAIEHRARLAAFRSFAAGREDLYRGLVDGVRERLAQAGGDDRHRARLEALVAEALEAVPEAHRVRVEARDVAPVRELLARRGRGEAIEVVDDLPGPALGGCVVEDGHGRRVTNTMASRLDRADVWLRRLFAERVPVTEGEAR